MEKGKRASTTEVRNAQVLRALLGLLDECYGAPGCGANGAPKPSKPVALGLGAGAPRTV